MVNWLQVTISKRNFSRWNMVWVSVRRPHRTGRAICKTREQNFGVVHDLRREFVSFASVSLLQKEEIWFWSYQYLWKSQTLKENLEYLKSCKRWVQFAGVYLGENFRRYFVWHSHSSQNWSSKWCELLEKKNKNEQEEEEWQLLL